MGRELIGKRTRKGTEANLMRCDKEWKGGGEGEGEGEGGGGGEDVSPRSGARDRGQRVRSAARFPFVAV